METIEVFDYNSETIIIRLDQIETIRRPSGRVHDNGGIRFLSGRDIGLGPGQIDNIIKAFKEYNKETK